MGSTPRPLRGALLTLCVAGLGCPLPEHVRLIYRNFDSFEQALARIEEEDEVQELDVAQCDGGTSVSAVTLGGAVQKGRLWFSTTAQQWSARTFHEGPPGSLYNMEVHCVGSGDDDDKAIVTAVRDDGTELRATSWEFNDLKGEFSSGSVRDMGPAQTMDTFQDRKTGTTGSVTYLPEGNGKFLFREFQFDEADWDLKFSYEPESPTGVAWDATTGSPAFKGVYFSEGKTGLSFGETFIERQFLNLTVFDGNGEVERQFRYDEQPPPVGFDNTIETDLVYAFGKVYSTYHITDELGVTSARGACIDPESGESNTVFLGGYTDFGEAFGKVPSLKVVPLHTGPTGNSTSVNFVRFVPGDHLYGGAGGSEHRGIEVSSFDRDLGFCIKLPIPVPYDSPVIAIDEADVPNVSQGAPDDTLGKIKLAMSIASIDIFELTLSSRLNFAQFADGAGLFSQLILSNPGADPVSARLSFRDSQGQPIPLDHEDGRLTVPGADFNGVLDVDVPPSGKLTLQSDGAGDVVVGSVTVVSGHPLSGVVVFGGAAGLAGVDSSARLTDGFSTPVETSSEEQIDTGVAVMNLGEAPVTLKITLCDADGNPVAAAADIVLAARGQRARFVTELEWDAPVDFSAFDGVLKVSADGEIAATVLQTRQSQFASLPVAAN